MGCVLFFLFLPMYAIIWWKKFNAVSKLAQLEKVEWKYFCSPIQGFQRAFFPDQLITQTDSEQMLLFVLLSGPLLWPLPLQLPCVPPETVLAN